MPSSWGQAGSFLHHKTFNERSETLGYLYYLGMYAGDKVIIMTLLLQDCRGTIFSCSHVDPCSHRRQKVNHRVDMVMAIMVVVAR